MTDFELFMKEINVTPEQLEVAKQKATYTSGLPSSLCLGLSSIEGEGVFAKTEFNPGETLDQIQSNNNWTQSGLKMNHSPNPNVELHGINLVARDRINIGDEILVNYRNVKQEMEGY